MSNSYPILPGLELDEQSMRLEFSVVVPSESPGCMPGDMDTFQTPDFTPAQLRTAIIKQIEVLSYFSDDPEEVLKRFNVKYGETE